MPPDQIHKFNSYVALANSTLNMVSIAALFRMEIVCALLSYGAQLQSPSAATDDVLTKNAVPAFRRLWARLLAWERLCEELATRFGDPVVVPAEMTAVLGHARELLTEWNAIVKPEVQSLRLPRMDAAELGALREVLAAQERLHP
jgi:hypothetical protein